MSRLITEESVYEYLSSKFDEFDISIFGNEFAGKILDGLSDIPTAYDVEKVLAKLEELKSKYNKLREVCEDKFEAFELECKCIQISKDIEIAKRGGVEW